MDNSIEKDIYKMKLHEFFWHSDLMKTIVRVSGGWLYCDYDNDKDMNRGSGTFVPFNDEFSNGG